MLELNHITNAMTKLGRANKTQPLPVLLF